MTSVTLRDVLYGEFTITEPVLVDVLNSAAVRRLRGVHQAGASALVRPGRDLARYDHVVGVGLLIRRVGGSVEEQAAGFIHDVSHTAFSHVGDLVFDRRDEGYHDDLMAELVAKSDLPSILGRHALYIKDLIDLTRWTLLEQPLPDLCADRVDYTLRDLQRMGWISRSEISSFVEALVVRDGKLAVNDVDAAEWFAVQFYREVRDLFMDPLELWANSQLAKAIRLALESGAITPEDLLATDDVLLERLRLSRLQEVEALLDRLTTDARVIEDPDRYEFRAYSKARTVDPLVVLSGGGVERLSQLRPDVARLHQEVHKRAAEGVFVRMI